MRGRIALGLGLGIGMISMTAQAQSTACLPDPSGRTHEEVASQLNATADVVMAGAVLKVAPVIQDGVERTYVFMESRRIWRGFVPQYFRFPLDSCAELYQSGVKYLLFLDRDPRSPKGEYRLASGSYARPFKVAEHEDLVDELGDPQVRWNSGRRTGPDLVPGPADGYVALPVAALPVGAAAVPAPTGVAQDRDLQKVVLDKDCEPAPEGERGLCIEAIPAYPPAAAAGCVAGRVIANVNVEASGEVLFVNVVEEDPVDQGFATRAVEALLQTRFQPAAGAAASVPIEVRRETVLFEPANCSDGAP